MFIKSEEFGKLHILDYGKASKSLSREFLIAFEDLDQVIALDYLVISNSRIDISVSLTNSDLNAVLKDENYSIAHISMGKKFDCRIRNIPANIIENFQLDERKIKVLKSFVSNQKMLTYLYVKYIKDFKIVSKSFV